MITKELFKVGSSFPSTKSITFENKNGNVDLMIHYTDEANLLKGLPNQIAQYDIAKSSVEDKTDHYSFTMRVSNNIHNVSCLDEVEFIQEWTEQEKIAVKASPVSKPNPVTLLTTPKEEEKKTSAEKKSEKKKSDKKKGEKSPPTEGEEKAPTVEAPIVQPEQKYEMKEKKKKIYSNIKFSTSSYALGPAQRKAFTDLEDEYTAGDADIL